MTVTVTTVHQTDDQTPLSDVLPLRDVDTLTDEQRDALHAAINAALRPLVEDGWAAEGCGDVVWHRHPYPRTIVDADWDTISDYETLEVGVWGAAWQQLDADAIWAQVIGG